MSLSCTGSVFIQIKMKTFVIQICLKISEKSLNFMKNAWYVLSWEHEKHETWENHKILD